ncbi:MAG: hypothetical protein AAGE84_04450 [Cyanobacteria bacterium P01_G01_bin.39]
MSVNQDLSTYYNSKAIDQRLEIDNQILESLHWKRRAFNSSDINEKILWSWVGIENIFEDTKLIFDIIPKFQATINLYQFTWKHFRKLYLTDELGELFFDGFDRQNDILSMELKTAIEIDEKEVKPYLKV